MRCFVCGLPSGSLFIQELFHSSEQRPNECSYKIVKIGSYDVDGALFWSPIVRVGGRWTLVCNVNSIDPEWMKS